MTLLLALGFVIIFYRLGLPQIVLLDLFCNLIPNSQGITHHYQENFYHQTLVHHFWNLFHLLFLLPQISLAPSWKTKRYHPCTASVYSISALTPLLILTPQCHLMPRRTQVRRFSCSLFHLFSLEEYTLSPLSPVTEGFTCVRWYVSLFKYSEF